MHGSMYRAAYIPHKPYECYIEATIVHARDAHMVGYYPIQVDSLNQQQLFSMSNDCISKVIAPKRLLM